MSEPVLPPGWTCAVPQELAADEPNALGIGPFGSNLKVSDYKVSGVPLVFVRNIRSGIFDDDIHYVAPHKAEELIAHEVRPGDVLITKMGDPPGDSALYPQNRPVGIITADCIKWRIAPTLGVAEFFVYATRAPSVQRQIQGITSGVAQKKVSLERFRTVKYPVAPVAEQLRITEALDSYFTRLDDVVVTLERVQRSLKRYRASVLKAAVEGRLLPTEAEVARAEKRDYEPASEFLKRILAERRRCWNGKGKYEEPAPPDTSNLPELPEGWCWTTLAQLGQVSGGLTQNAKRNALNLRLPYLRVANVYANELRLDDVAEIGVDESEIQRALLARGDLLVVEGNGSPDQIGRVATWDGSVARCLHQNHLIKVRFEPVSLSSWAMFWLLSPEGRSVIQQVASSTSGLHTLSISKVSALPVPLCPIAEQERIRAEVDRLLSLTSAMLDSVEAGELRASRLRQSILKWAFEGKLVDQDPNDEPASALLERIRAERSGTTDKKTPARRARQIARNA
ncbi:hypothetical protein [Sorangium sp. So ce341]|uniref:hypothetical protein n=1 Tax=Sorangium sp. So ce341 TaxID=3133302 RepID=UPI003F619D91